jgi:hypothetical protein
MESLTRGSHATNAPPKPDPHRAFNPRNLPMIPA